MQRWDRLVEEYLARCSARGVSAEHLQGVRRELERLGAWLKRRRGRPHLEEVGAEELIRYLRNRTTYRAIVAMGHLLPAGNPLAQFPKIKATPRKLPVVLSEIEVEKLLDRPGTDTVLGLRDRAILALLYGTGIRASECSGLREEDVDLGAKLVKVRGKGGHERTVPLNDRVCRALEAYRRARGLRLGGDAFFESCRGQALGRGAVYERVRRHSLACQIPKRVSPHRLRHTFATHLVKAGVGLVTIRDLLGHRQITSTQIYLHVTAEDLRHAAERHPIGRLAATIGGLLPEIRRPVMKPPARRASG